MSGALLAKDRKYMAAWLKANSCTYPECQCKELHELVEETKNLARQIGHEFVPEQHKVAQSPWCRAKYWVPEE